IDQGVGSTLTIDYFDELDFFNDFENEFPAIVYNDAQKSKSDYLTEPILNLKHIDEFNLNDETSLSEYDKENVLCFNDLFNIIRPDDLKSKKDNDDNDIDIIQSLEGNETTPGENGLFETSHDKIIKTSRRGSFVINLKIEGYTEGVVRSYEQRLEMIWSRLVNWVYVLDFEGLTLGMRQDLAVRLRMVYTGEGQMSDTEMGLDVADMLCFQLASIRRRMTWRHFILALGIHTEQEMAEAGFRSYWNGSDRLIPDKGDLRDYWIEISSDRDFWGFAPSYVLIRDPVRILFHRMIAYSIFGKGQAPEKVTGVDVFYLRSMDRGTTNVQHLLARYLFRHAEGRKIRARFLGGHFIGYLAMHFGLVSDEGMRGLRVVTRELPLIDLHELGRLNICSSQGWRLGDYSTSIGTSTTSTHSSAPDYVIEDREDRGGAAILIRHSIAPSLVARMPYQRRFRPNTGDASTSAASHTDAHPDL
ncbi:hypothetical protein Tco_0312249, partial [Tanacetum coccineum]